MLSVGHMHHLNLYLFFCAAFVNSNVFTGFYFIYFSGDTNVPETESFEKRTSPCTKLFPKEMQTTQPKMCKRHCNQNCCVAECTDDILPCKKIKLSVCEYTGHCAESNTQNGCCLNDLKQTEAVAKETIALSAFESSFSGGLKLATPVQALLAKNTGDKVTLTNQLIANASRTINVLEKSLSSSSETSNTKSTLLCQANSKNPLQVVYKMPGGQCVPLNLQNSSVKIQMQPVLDPKTGEKLMQQVLILPKNIFLQHKECKSTGKESVPLQPTPAEQVFATSPQTANVTFSATAPVLGAGYSQSSSSVPGKNIAHLTKLSHPTGSPPLPTTVMPSPTKETLSDTNKLTTTTTTFPLTTALAPVAAAFQPPVLVATLGEDSNSSISSPHETVQNTSDASEMKQELKTVCIRDSQSILVRTRGGNTGVVKVQANPENCSTSSLATSSVFTFTPSGQAFLVSRATTAQPSSMLSSVTSSTTVSTALPFAQPTESRFSSPATIPSCSNQVRGKEVKLTASQPDGGAMGHLPGTTVQPPTYLPSCSLTNSWLPSTSSSSDFLINTGAASLNTMESVKMSQSRMAAIAQVTSAPSEMGHATDKLPVLHNSATPANGDMISGAPVQKLLLVTSPVIPSGDGVTVGTIPRPTSTTPTPQKLILINTNISSVSSASCFAAETTKQMLPSALGKAVLNTPEQPHLVLIPSTVGASIKLCPSATVSQIKEVKIGLNIGQTIINTSGTALNTPPVNLLQNASCRAAEDKIRKGFVLPITTNNLFPLCPLSQYTIAGNKSRDVGARGSSSFAGTVNLCRGSISATTNTSVATSSGLMNHTNDRTSIGTPSVANRLSASNVGNTVAISTVKTSHLASSVLISTTQSTIPPQSIPTTLFPGVVSFPAPVTNTQKLKNLVPTAVPFLPISKGLPQAIMRYPSSGNTSSLLPSTNIQTSQALFPSPLTNAKTVIANIASLPHDKTTTALPRNSAPVVSSVVQTPIATAPLASPAGQFGETCIQQKIVLNTNAPLAPGTQIMINGNRFIVPSHGLAAGSHVLLISTNAKQGPPLVLNAQSVQIPVGNQAILKNPQCNLNLQPSKHPLKSSTNIVNSLGSAVVPPIVHASPHVNMMAKSYAASPATSNSVGSIPMPQAALVAKTSLDSLRDGGNIIFPSSTSALHLDKTVKKLLLSPEGAILNSINSSVSKFAPLLPATCHILESARKTLPTVLPTPQTSGSENMNMDAS